MVLFGLSLFVQEPSISALDNLAQARDVAKLTAMLDTPPKFISPFSILKTNGAYEVGKFGWHVLPLNSADGLTKYAVFSTPLTSEDIGELVFVRQGTKLKYLNEDNALGVHVVHHKFDLQFGIPEKKAVIEDTVTFAANSAAGKSFLFRMGPQYRVSSIQTVAGAAVKFFQAGGVVSVSRSTSTEWTYKIRYEAIVNLQNYAASISDKEATLTNDYWYPMIARNPATYELVVHGPKGWTAVGQGDQIAMKETATERITSFKMDLPVTYFSLSCGPYKSSFQKIEGRTLGMWSTRVKPDQMRLQAPLFAPILQFYEHFAPFPFSSYGALDSEFYGGGAMEAYSYATYGGGVPAEDAHEPAHTWWGGIIPNTYLHSFWNESFAVYCEGLYAREVSSSYQDERRLAFIRTATGQPSYDSYPIAQAGAEVGSVASDLGYGKGAFVLQMLEHEIGASRLIHCMREWIRLHPKGTAGEWTDFEKVVLAENASKNLKSFFDDWLRKPGYARLSAEKPTFANGTVSIPLTWHGTAYRMPIEVMIQFPGGRREFLMKDIVPVNGKATFTMPADSKPEIVSIDPHRRLLRDIRADEAPISLDSVLAQLRGKVVRDKAQPKFAPELIGTEGTADDPAGKVLVGHPDTMPGLKPLLEKLGWTVVKNRLTYDETVIDLNNGAAYGIVDLGGGRRCVVVLGRTLVRPDFGRSWMCLVDQYGRFQRGRTEPKTSGNLTFRL